MGDQINERAVLRNTIPKICYLAEVLGLGHFEITVIAHYVNNNYKFTDPEHSKLNEHLAFYNYEFENYFINDSVSKKSKIKIAELECHADQIPITEEIISASKLIQQIRQRMTIVHGAPVNTPVPTEYWWLGNINTKLNVFNQVRYFVKTNRLTKVSVTSFL